MPIGGKFKLLPRLIFVIVIGVLAFLETKLFGVFWVNFILTCFAFLFTGFVARWEDNRPGGFNSRKSDLD